MERHAPLPKGDARGKEQGHGQHDCHQPTQREPRPGKSHGSLSSKHNEYLGFANDFTILPIPSLSEFTGLNGGKSTSMAALRLWIRLRHDIGKYFAVPFRWLCGSHARPGFRLVRIGRRDGPIFPGQVRKFHLSGRPHGHRWSRERRGSGDLPVQLSDRDANVPAPGQKVRYVWKSTFISIVLTYEPPGHSSATHIGISMYGVSLNEVRCILGSTGKIFTSDCPG